MIRKTFLLAALCSALATMATAQRMTDMVWDTHGLGFKVPVSFKIETNTGDEFTAGNDELQLIMEPIQDENIAESDLAQAVLTMAKELEYDKLTDVDEIKVDNFVGYYIEGEKDGAHALVMALLDTESSTNLLLVLAYTEAQRDAAIKIVHSLYTYEK